MPRRSKQLSDIRHEQFELLAQLHDLRRCEVSRFTLLRAHDIIQQWLHLSSYRHRLHRNRLGWVTVHAGVRAGFEKP